MNTTRTLRSVPREMLHHMLELLFRFYFQRPAPPLLKALPDRADAVCGQLSPACSPVRNHDSPPATAATSADCLLPLPLSGAGAGAVGALQTAPESGPPTGPAARAGRRLRCTADSHALCSVHGAVRTVAAGSRGRGSAEAVFELRTAGCDCLPPAGGVTISPSRARQHNTLEPTALLHEAPYATQLSRARLDRRESAARPHPGRLSGQGSAQVRRGRGRSRPKAGSGVQTAGLSETVRAGRAASCLDAPRCRTPRRRLSGAYPRLTAPRRYTVIVLTDGAPPAPALVIAGPAPGAQTEAPSSAVILYSNESRDNDDDSGRAVF